MRNLAMIFVDDASPDESLDQAVSLLVNDPCARITQLSRNFGHHKAAQQLRLASLMAR
jgi:putative glycosyltransferase